MIASWLQKKREVYPSLKLKNNDGIKGTIASLFALISVKSSCQTHTHHVT